MGLHTPHLPLPHSHEICRHLHPRLCRAPHSNGICRHSTRHYVLPPHSQKICRCSTHMIRHTHPTKTQSLQLADPSPTTMLPLHSHECVWTLNATKSVGTPPTTNMPRPLEPQDRGTPHPRLCRLAAIKSADPRTVTECADTPVFRLLLCCCTLC